MRRKVIKQAGQAYTITLPIDWVRTNNIDKDSEVDVLVSEKDLIIRTDNLVKGSKVDLVVKEVDRRIITMIINSLYAKGVDEIHLSCKEDISSIISANLNANIGYALISQEKDAYTIKDISGGNYQNLDETFKRVFQMILLFYDSAIEDIFGEEKATIEDLESRDTEVNKFCLYLERAVNKMSYSNQINGRIMFTYSFALEKISDEIERLWRTNIKYKIKKTKELKNLFLLSKEGLSQSFDLYYQFNQELMKNLHKTKLNVREKSLSLMIKDPATARAVRHAVKIIEDAADLTHLTVMRSLN